MADTRAAAVAALAEPYAKVMHGRADERDCDSCRDTAAIMLDAILADPAKVAALLAVLDAILADPAKVAALLAVLLTPEPIADVLGDALDGYGDPDQWAAAIIRRLTTTKEQT